ncbi:MAG: sensor histidine kinase [Clostridia bacterium]|nr:sensor histidine kinase [Clostridia bacterium]
MKELSLNILDIVQNSLTARSTFVEILLEETEDALRITVRDNGCGMSEEMAKRVTDPFCTSRKTRKVGLGIPFFKLAAEQTGGSLELESVSETVSPEDHGTVISGLFFKNHLDFTPLGDIVSTLCTLIQGCGDTDIRFLHSLPGGVVELDTREIREALGGLPLCEPEILLWIRDNLDEQYADAGL